MYLLPDDIFSQAMAVYARKGLASSARTLPDDPAALAGEGGGDDPEACCHEDDLSDAELDELRQAQQRRAGTGWRATWLADAFRAEGLTVVEVEGWRTRGVAFPDPPVEEGVSLFHHTASSASSGPTGGLRIVTYGRPGLPGPIANWLTGRNGVVYVIASGVANHAGRGNARAAGFPALTGNSNSFGNEMENDGLGERYSPAQYTAAIKAHAALHRRLGWPATRGIGHKEWSVTGKPDPRLDMNQVRRDLATTIARGSVPASGGDELDMDQDKFNDMLAAAFSDKTVARRLGDALKENLEYGIDPRTKKGTKLGAGLLAIDDKLDKVIGMLTQPRAEAAE